MDASDRVAVTGEAAALVRRLPESHGPVMFHQSGGCCDGSSPMCYPDGDFVTGDADVHLGDRQGPEATDGRKASAHQRGSLPAGVSAGQNAHSDR